MKIVSILLSLVLALLFMVACGGKTEPETTNKANENTKTEATPKPEEKSSTDENKLATPKDSIAYQFDLIKKGDFETLKTCCFTEKAADNLTKEIVEKAQKDASQYTMEDLVDAIEDGEADGKQTAKIIMKNGKTLTTLIKTDGKWLADTIWFK
jgi:hypothetical protein